MGNQSKIIVEQKHLNCYLMSLILLLPAPTWSQDEPPQPILEIGKGVLQAETGYAKFTPNGQEIVTCLGQILFWDANTGELLRSFPGGLPIALSLDEENILVTRGQNVELRNIENEEIIRSFDFSSTIRGVSISPDDSKILIGLRNGEAHLFEVQTGLNLWNTAWVDDGVPVVQFSKNGDFFIIGGNNEWIGSGIGIFSRTTLEPIQYLKGMGNWFDGAILSRDDTSILVWGWSFGAYLYDVETGQRIVEYANADCMNASISPNGTLVILGYAQNARDYPNQATLVDTETSAVLRSFEYDGTVGYSGTVDFSPDGTKVLTTGGGRVMVWDISDLTEPASVGEWSKY